MERAMLRFASVVVLGGAPVFAQTADHAPTKPAADAAAKYDRSVEGSGAAGKSRDGPSGGSKSPAPAATGDDAAPNDGVATTPNARKTERAK